MYIQQSSKEANKHFNGKDILAVGSIIFLLFLNQY